MEILMAIVVGLLYAAGIYLMQRRNMVMFLIGLALLSHGANLLIFTAGGLTRGQPPLIPENADMPVAMHADPLPQALILTAIVISFGVLAFALILFLRAYQTTGTDDLHDLRSTDT
jgi:multicomponent Na+:H+ antiporter subunit C